MQQFISVDSGGLFRVDAAAATFLRAIPAPCTVVSVVGRYRTGKSSLLNGLAQASVFSTSPTVQAHTKGLSLYSPEPGLVLVDSEGLGSTQVSKQHDAAIFALTMVISSGCFFNNLGGITSQDLEDLRLAAKVAGMLVTHGKLGITMPPLVWVMRDFSLELKDAQGLDMDATSYLEECLSQFDTSSDLRALFPGREAMTLCRPSDREIDIQTWSNLRPEFRAGLEQVRRRMRYFPAKSRAGQQMSGMQVCDLATALCGALNEGTVVPSMDSVWGAMLEKMRTSARQHALCVFQEQAAWPAKIRETAMAYQDCLRGETVTLEEGLVLLEELARGDRSHENHVLQIEAEKQLMLAMEERLSETTRATELTRERITELTTTVLTLETTLRDTERRLADECARASTLEASLVEGVDQLKRRYKSVVVACEQTKAHRDELSAKLVRVTEELTEAKSQATTSEQQCAEQRRQNEDTVSKSGQLRTDVEVWRSRYEDGQARHAKRLKTADSAQVDLITAQAELHYLRRTKEDYDKQLAQLHTENASLHRQIQTLSVYASFEQA